MRDKNILYLCGGFEYNERIAKSEITTGASDPSERSERSTWVGVHA